MSSFLRSSPAQESKESERDHTHQISDNHSRSQPQTQQGTENIDPALYSESPSSKDQKKQSSNGGKISNQMTPSNFTGWTPLISKTINNEQLLNFNSTPSSKLINNLLSNPNNPQSATSILPQNDIDYSNGLNLTPFLNQNLNLLNSNSHSNTNSNNNGNNLTSFTPFQDRSLHLTDFFMESPIRATPIKDLDTITPSKFKIGSETKLVRPSIFQDPKSAKKRSIHDLESYTDTPNKPHKLSISTGANDMTDEEEDDDDDNQALNENAKLRQGPDKSKRAKIDTHKSDNDSNKSQKGTFVGFQTPSKVTISSSSKAFGVNGKTPVRNTLNEFETPAKPTENSSPSTVILSSTSKSPLNDNKKFIPNSPTPNPTSNNSKSNPNVNKSKPPMSSRNVQPSKFSIYSNAEAEAKHDEVQPPMGTFSDSQRANKCNGSKKNKKHDIKPLGNANTNTMNNVNGGDSSNHNISNYRKNNLHSDNRLSRRSSSAHSGKNDGVSGNRSEMYSHDEKVRFKAANKAQMQAGMNKFQIVLSDGMGAKRGRKGRKPAGEKKKGKKEVTVQTQAHGDHVLPRHEHHRSSSSQMKHDLEPHSIHNQLVSHDNNMSTTKDSSIMSGTNNSMNTSNVNLSGATDHTSFEFGALSSTPNGKYFLDKIFEKPSPQSQHLLNQVLMSQHYGTNMNVGKPGDMPPPKVQSISNPLQSTYQNNNIQGHLHPQYQPSHQHGNQGQVMMMSTPNHSSFYSPHGGANDNNSSHHNVQAQGNNDSRDENEEGNISLSAFAYNNYIDRKDVNHQEILMDTNQ